MTTVLAELREEIARCPFAIRVSCGVIRLVLPAACDGSVYVHFPSHESVEHSTFLVTRETCLLYRPSYRLLAATRGPSYGVLATACFIPGMVVMC